jgi:hypothetical protein
MDGGLTEQDEIAILEPRHQPKRLQGKGSILSLSEIIT